MLLSNELNWMLEGFSASLSLQNFKRRFVSYAFCFGFYFFFYFCCSKLITASAWHVLLLDFFLFVCLLLLSLSMFMFNYPFYGRGLFIYPNVFIWNVLRSPSDRRWCRPLFCVLFLFDFFSYFEFVYIKESASQKKQNNLRTEIFLKRITSI